METKGAVAAREETLVRGADVVVTTSERLRKMRSKLNPSTYFVPNAADFELFSSARDEPTQLAGELMALPKPVVGYVGMLHPKLVDVGCVEYLASRSGYSIVFVGRAIGRSLTSHDYRECRMCTSSDSSPWRGYPSTSEGWMSASCHRCGRIWWTRCSR